MLGKRFVQCVIVMAVTAIMLSPVASPIGTDVQTRNGVPVLSGYIKDSVGDPIQGAVVRIVLADMSDYDYGFTDALGAYSINVSFTGLCFIEAESPGYLKHRSAPFMIDPGINVTYNVTLPDLPIEMVTVSGTVTFEEGGAAEGVSVRLKFESMGHYYDYEDVTDASGSFDMTVFSATYSIRMSYHGFTVYEDMMELSMEGSPYILSPEIPLVPDITTTIKGFVDDGTSPLEGAFIVIADQPRELQTYTVSNGSGYFEAVFWGGDHIIITMMPGYDNFFSRITVPDSGTIWVNITTKVQDQLLSGTVLDPSGDPVEGINVQLSRPYVFPDQYSALTDADGDFEMTVSEGGGYLVVSGEDPFESGEYELYFEKIAPITEDRYVEVHLNEVVDQLMTSEIAFEDWDGFTVDAAMNLPLNNTRYMRLFVDIYVGNMDQILSEDEFQLFYDMMMADSDMQTAPMGINTSTNITIDGLFYDRVSQSIDFVDMAGSVDDMTASSVRIDAEYALNGSLPELSDHTLWINMSYDDPGSRTVATALVPEGWILYNHTAEHIGVDHEDGRIILTPGEDPDPEDDVSWEHITLNFIVDDLMISTNPPDAYEGVSSRFQVMINDSIPENIFNITWDMGDSQVLNTNVRYVDYTYADDGEYIINISLTDAFGRNRTCAGTVNVLNMAPSVVLSASSSDVLEGDTVVLTVNASDVAADTMSVSWSENGSFGDPILLSNSSMDYPFHPLDEGNYTVFVRVQDEDGGVTERNITIAVRNRDPSISAELVLPHEGNVTYENETVRIRIIDAIDTDELNFSVSVSRSDNLLTAVDVGSIYDVKVLGPGKYGIVLKAADPDGGSASLEWSIQVTINESLDHDGDGIPMNWEKEHGLDDYKKGDGASDPDKDGLSNYEEYLKGSDPLDENDPIEQKGDGDPTLIIIIIVVVLLVIIIVAILVVQNLMKERIEEE